MRRKLYHVTTDGVEVCKNRICSDFKKHFDDLSIANEDYKTQKRNEAHLRKVDFLERILTDTRFENEYKHVAPFSFRYRHSLTVRNFGHSVDHHIKKWQMSPILHKAIMSVDFTHVLKQTITITRSSYVNRDEPCFDGHWEMELKDTTVAYGYHQKKSIQAKVKTIALNFEDRDSTIASLETIYNVFYESYQADDADFRIDVEEQQLYEAKTTAQAKHMVDNFWCAYLAVESEVDPVGLWENGYGYFEGSDSDVIKVSVNYDMTSFRAKSFTDFLQSNPYYASKTPNTEIYVFDDNLDTGAGWSIRLENNTCHIVNTFADGTAYNKTVTSAEDAYAHIYWHVIKEVNVDNQEAAFEKAQYVADLMTTIENERTLNKEKVFYNWEVERLVKVARANGHDIQPFFDLTGYSLDALNELGKKTNKPTKRKK